MKQRNTVIDCAKYIASLLIVAIHTGLFSDVNDTLYFVVVQILCRLAVPFFAVCTGYYLAQQLQFGRVLSDTAENKRSAYRYWKKLLFLYSGWTLVYLFHSIPMWIDIGWFSPFAFVDFAIAAVTQGSHYHFWYLWALIYTFPIFYVVLRIVDTVMLYALTAFLWLANIITYVYHIFLPAPFSQIADALQGIASLLRILPLLLLGAIISRASVHTDKKNRLCTAFFFILLIAEAFILKNQGQTAVSYLLFTFPTIYFLFQFLLRCNIHIPARIHVLGKTSTFIYCVHPILIEITDNYITHSVIHFVIVAITATILGFLATKLKPYIRKKVRICSN